MSSPKSNIAKWVTYQDGLRLYGPTGVGQNLNADLEGRIADDIDVVLGSVIGDGVIGSESWLVTPSSVALTLDYAAGSGFIRGQRIYSVAGSLLLPASTSNITVYADLGASNTFSNTNKAWATDIGYVVAPTPLPTGAITIASISSTPGSGNVIPSGNVTDIRRITETQPGVAISVLDTTPISSTAFSIRQRLGMFANLFRQIIGGANWLVAVPASLTTIWGKFHASTGHVHSGGANDAPKVAGLNVNFTPTGLPNQITSTNVQQAIVAVDSTKLRLDGTLPMSGHLILFADPEQPLQAATKQYVDTIARSPQVQSGAIKTNAAMASSESSLLNSAITLTSRGGPIRIESNAKLFYWLSPGIHSEIDVDLIVKLYRNGVEVQRHTQHIFVDGEDPFITLPVSPNYDYRLPIFYDQPAAGSYTYDVRWNYVTYPGHGGGVLNYPSVPQGTISSPGTIFIVES